MIPRSCGYATQVEIGLKFRCACISGVTQLVWGDRQIQFLQLTVSRGGMPRWQPIELSSGALGDASATVT